MDNRPLRFDEFLAKVNQLVFVSATPGAYELRESAVVAEQLIRPTGVVDPEVEIRATRNQIDDLLGEIRRREEAGERVLVTTLTKKMAEDLTDYLVEAGVRTRYLHSEVDTLERIQIIRELRLGDYDVLVGVNLLREGLDLPEVSLVAILDADKEGFLRGKTALLQTIGRAARNVHGKVLMYADKRTEAIQGALEETDRRRATQLAYNEEHGIVATTIVKSVSDIAEFLTLDAPTVPGRRRRGKAEAEGMTAEEIERLVITLEEEMIAAAEELRFEYAAKLRDEIKELRRELAWARPWALRRLRAWRRPGGVVRRLARQGCRANVVMTYSAGVSKMITVRTPEELVARLDDLVASGVYESRAAAILDALERLVVELEREAVDRAIVKGYTRIPPTDGELAWAEAAGKRSIADERW